MGIEFRLDDPGTTDEAYFDEARTTKRGFDERLLQEPLAALQTRIPVVFSPADSATDAMRAMQRKHRGCVLITEDGTMRSRLIGIFTERDILNKVIDRGRNPATICLDEIMTPEPESLPHDARLAWALNLMSVGGFRHVPVTDEDGRPVTVVSVRDVVEFLVEAFPTAILNLPPDFGRKQDYRRDGA